MDLDTFLEAKTHQQKVAYHRWQDEAVRYAKELGFAPNRAWFAFFKRYFTAHEPRFRTMLEMAQNPNIKKKCNFFFWYFHNK